MKIFIFFLLVFVCGGVILSQENLVPNGNFDENTNSYRGGNDPTSFYSGVGCKEGRKKFEEDITAWFVSKPAQFFLIPCSPDWIKPGLILGDGSCPANDSYYVRSASKQESIMVELKDGYKLKKGQSYKFRIRYRHALGMASESAVGSFQLVFSTKEKGLRVSNPKNKWVAADVYDVHTCYWRYYETYFTVPNDNENNYEDMKYLILQYNHGYNESADEPIKEGDASLIIHYDDVFLAEGERCEDIKYIQDWQYNENKIEQANLEIRAGAHVSPYSWPANNPVIVKSNAKVIYRAPTVYL